MTIICYILECIICYISYRSALISERFFEPTFPSCFYDIIYMSITRISKCCCSSTSIECIRYHTSYIFRNISISTCPLYTSLCTTTSIDSKSYIGNCTIDHRTTSTSVCSTCIYYCTLNNSSQRSTKYSLYRIECYTFVSISRISIITFEST